MRVVLVGASRARARLRGLLPADVEVAGEAATVSAARSAAFDADAWLVAPPDAATADPEDVEPLTAREHEVLELLARGLANKAIAARLGISDQTVKFHVASICGKLGAANRTQAARRALQRGLIPF